ncbi:putative Zinc finger, SWIM-type [Rosa chinensis]|uniref:Putative Zinc finger, SWIM-type n=1 Tax=Rosa chinensis TaxID=74649 RepID=A0A2P6QNN5_ROSCH|nr:uncharacterized protein LOC112167716 [Rosa chinensis]PRQ35778.1 putative Zinc finger, SWIM-type [Rosa chinensis]
MARWDEILSLPVQNPPTLEFSAADLVWSKVEGWRDKKDRVAVIPYARVDAFVRGESSNKECPTRFHVEARRRRQAKTNCKPKVDGILEYILYWCSFGPDDHRMGGSIRPSRTNYVPKKKNSGRPNTKRGCTCHFMVKRLIAEPSVALLVYNSVKHVDKKGLPCHGPEDKMASGTRAMFAPYISEDLRLRVLSLLYVGVSVETIMQRHAESVERQGGPCNRDDLLTHRYVRRQERIIRRSTYELDAEDAVSIGMWVENHQNIIFFYEDFSETDPFTLGIQTDWQLQQMIRFGNHSLIASDSRFGTNKLKYPVHSLLVFNQDNKAIPVAWIVSPKFASSDTHKWMRALYNRVQTKDPSWKLAGFIVDDPQADVHTIRDVFQCSVLISFWRVRHGWHKNLVKKCLEDETRATISRRLHQAVDNICQQRGTDGLFADFMEDFVDASDFVDYFKATWYPRIGKWTTALQSLPLTSQETCAAMEFYHNQLKLRLLNEKKPCVYKRVDWLVDKLGTQVHSYFWLDEYSEKDDFARYWKNEWVSGLTSWRTALEIPDSNVVIEGTCAKVTDRLDQEKAYVVWNPGSQFSICNCSWAEMGNLCEHILKVISVCRKRSHPVPSVSILQFHQALLDMLHCPPHDSLIRDHAVSLAVFVQNQLNGPNLESSNSTTDQAAFADKDLELVNEGPVSEGVLSHNENSCADEHVAVGTETSSLVACGNGIYNAGCGDEITSSEMDVDPSSICISPPGLHSVDEVVSGGVLSRSRQRPLFNTETEDLLPADDPLAKSSEYEDDMLDENCEKNVMSTDPLSLHIPCSAMEFVEQYTVPHSNDLHSHEVNPAVISKVCDDNTVYNNTSPSSSVPVEPQASGVIENESMEIESVDGMDFVEHCPLTNPYGNHSHDIDIAPTVISKRSPDNTVYNKTSASASMPVESEMVVLAETSGIILENGRMEIGSENGNTSKHNLSADNPSTLDGIRGCMINESDFSQDSESVGNAMVVYPEPLLKFSSTSSCNKEELPVENGATETGSSEKPSSITESHLKKCKLQDGAEIINNNEVIRQPVISDINVTSAKGNARGESANAF